MSAPGDNGIAVTVIATPEGVLVRIDYRGGALFLMRTEADSLLRKLNERLGEGALKILWDDPDTT